MIDKFFIFLLILFPNIIYSQHIKSHDTSQYYVFIIDAVSNSIAEIQLMKNNKVIAEYGYANSSVINNIVHYEYDDSNKIIKMKDWFNSKLITDFAGSSYIPLKIFQYIQQSDSLSYGDDERIIESKRYKTIYNKKGKPTKKKELIKWYKFFYCYECYIYDPYW